MPRPHATHRPGTLLPLEQRVLDVCQAQLRRPTSARDVAGVLLGAMLTRPDTGTALQIMAAWATAQLQGAHGPDAPFLLPGWEHTRNILS